MSTTQCTGTQEERERYLRTMGRLGPLSVPQGKLDRRTHCFEVRRKGQALGAFSTVAGAVHHAEYNVHFQEPLEVWGADFIADKLLAVVRGVGQVTYTDLSTMFQENSDAACVGSLD